MILNLGSLAFNSNVETGGGTPAWGTELGQGEGYKFAFEDMSDFFTGMVYKSISDIDKVTCPLGKGGNQRADYDFVIASLFDKIFVNGRKVNDARFLLLVVKKLNGEHHVGRRTIKYNPRMTYHGEYINDDCFKKIAATMGLPEDAAWFVYEIFIENQDELHFTAYELGQEPQSYRNTEERKNAFIKRLSQNGKRLHVIAPQTRYIPQQIFYGAPGTGKSNTIKREVDEKGKKCFRTTFHPDSDYSTFVGCYKPSMKPTGVTQASKEKEEVITYKFIPQAFIRAYKEAWMTENDVFLVIEEINRGNCAQIFGDLFQLLDRKNGVSEYPVDADTDLQSYLQKVLADTTRTDIPEEVKSGKKLMLPSNLYIWATMNTSDQSLFPIDSAFKRRWEWKYIKIKEGKDENGNKLDWKVDVEIDGDGNKLLWWNFIKKINEIIASMTSSADKQLGYFFCCAKDGVIDKETFVSKVIFYLWNDVFKDYGFEDASLFRYTTKDDNGKEMEKDLTFPDFYDEDGEMVDEVRLTDFVKKVMNWKKTGAEID